MFYIMYGRDSFSLHEELKKIRTSLGNPEMLAVNTNVLEGGRLRLNQLQDVCNTVPFLHQFRLVIVEGLLGRFEADNKPGKRPSKTQPKPDGEMEEWQGLRSYVEEMPATTVLVVIDSALDERKNVLLRYLMPVATVKKFPQLKDRRARQRWIRDRIAEGGGTASTRVVELIEELVGSDLWQVSNEIEKLIVFSQGRPITENDVRWVTSCTYEVHIFALVDAVLEKRRKEAQHLLHRLLVDGMSPSRILAMITRQLRLILIAKELGPRASRQESMDRLGISSDYVFDRLLGQARMYTVDTIKKAYHEVLEADMAIKTGKYNSDLSDLSVELLVMDLCEI